MILHDVVDWDSSITCTPTALSAATGLSIGEIKNAIRVAAASNGRETGNFESVCPADWGQALKNLGFTWTYIRDENDPPISIDKFMNQNATDGVLLVLAFDTRGRGHVFAAHGKQFVDCHTKGRVSTYKFTSGDLLLFRVKYVLHLEKQ